MGRQDLRPEKIILRKNSQLKKPNIIAIVGRFLPVRFFPDSTRIELFSVPRLSTVIIKYQG